MLSIRFDKDCEWWVSSQVFERLFASALAHGQLSPELEEWRHVAEANGGLSLADIEPAMARSLKTGLRAAARAELARLVDVGASTSDGSYRAALEKLLAATRDESS